MKTHYSSELDDGARSAETASDHCVEEHHIDKETVSSEVMVAVVLAVMAAGITLLAVPNDLNRPIGGPGAGASYAKLMRQPTPGWQTGAAERRGETETVDEDRRP